MPKHIPILGLAILPFAGAWNGPSLAVADQLQPDINVTLTPHNPPIRVPGAGGTFGFGLAVANDAPLAHSCALWTTLVDAHGAGSEALYGPVDLSLPAAWSAAVDRFQDVSAELSAGPYTYTAHAGIYPDEIWSSDAFAFVKLPGSAGWYAQTPGTENALTGVSFVDAEKGWAVSDYREIIHSSDGGDTWHPQDDGQYYPHQYNDICFVDALHGWVVGHGWSLGGTILHTADGGDSWQEQSHETDYEFNHVFFLDAVQGWAAGGYYDLFGSNHRQIIEHTADGGQTWSQQYWDTYRYPLQSIHFADADHGWAVGGPGYMVHTSNGGQSWQEQYPGTNNYLNDVYFVSASLGWCVGDGGALRHTRDGGSSWVAQDPGIDADLNAVQFIDANTGWISGVDFSLFRPVILHTRDGGANWLSQNTGTGDAQIVLRDLCFIDEVQGWVAGLLWPGTGVLLHTETGGGFTGRGKFKEAPWQLDLR